MLFDSTSVRVKRCLRVYRIVVIEMNKSRAAHNETGSQQLQGDVPCAHA